MHTTTSSRYGYSLVGVCIYIMICIVLLALSDQYSSQYVYSLLTVLPPLYTNTSVLL